MATIVTDLHCDLTQPVKPQFLHGNMFSQDNAANTINVHVFNDGEPAALGGSISANVIRSDGSTVAVSGAIEGNKAYIILPQACYAIPGVIKIIIKNTESTTVTTIAAVVANVYASSTDTVVDPGTIIPSVTTLIAEIEAAVDSIPVDYSGLLATIAADYSSSKTYQVGQYAWQGGVLKRCIVPITTAETYTAAHWTNAVIGDDLSALKSAIQEHSANSIKKISASNVPVGDYTIVYPTFVQGGVSTSGSTQTPVSGGYVIHNNDTVNNNVRVYIFKDGTYTGKNLRDTDWTAIVEDEYTYLPIISGYTYMICYHSSGNITPENNSPEMLKLLNADEPMSTIVPGYAWNATDGVAANTKRAYMIYPGIKKGDVLTFDESYYYVNYYILGGNLTDLVYTPNSWDTTGEITINVPDDESYQLFVQFKWTDGDVIQPDRAVYIAGNTKLNKTNAGTVDVVIFMGQSNMAGRGVTNATWTEKAPKIQYGAGYEFKAISDPTRLYPAAEPFGVDENLQDAIDDTTPDNDDESTGTSKKTGSCVVALMNTYYDITGIPIVGVSASEGGTTISQWQPDTAKLNDAINRLSTCVSWLRTNKYYIRHIYMMWCQGENDAATPSADYKTAFSAMFAAMQAAGVEKCFLARIGEYNNNGSSAYSAMIQCQTEIGQEMENVVMCTTDLASFRARGLMKDKYHFYQAAYNEMGRYSGANMAVYVETNKEPTMYDPKYSNLYYSHKN